MASILGFDIETAQLAHEGFMGMSITCVGLWSLQDEAGTVGHGPVVGTEADAPYAPAMTQEEVAEIVGILLKKCEQGDTIVTWNGAGFDWPVLAACSGLLEECKYLALHHVDLGFLMLCLKGFMAGLEATGKGMDLGEKMEGMDGSLATILWTQGLPQQKRVLQYVTQDARLTAQIYQEALELGYARWVTGRGKISSWSVPQIDGRILTVEQALLLPLPDTNWMTNPRTREDILAWMNPEAAVTDIDTTSDVTRLECGILKLDLASNPAARVAAATYAQLIKETDSALSRSITQFISKY